ncbi:Iron-sulfur cluster repair di-iron protein [Petrocella atlantisensis]|uniref:Iron-sulfur cluster repair di-iron protein n=1 Tax=Petrocella atlantisensis TaxID=2173034 RepID=A0A3P7PX32_9FIRM|nr:iron-sulfur cluster repair di-iron protein [Petrocella atlantisensis]VDN48237.1 Iron-sulfur cluster repair di-iron protein [Petrocella atlantisensis]
MQKLNIEQTIGESVTLHPELVKVYMDYGVDFCCGGDRTVKEAIERDTHDMETLLLEADEAIENASKFTVDASSMKLTDFSTRQLIDRIIKEHHTYLKAELPIISELMFKILMVHGERHPELFEIHKLFGGLKTELEGHLVKEEVQLFPRLISNDPNCKALIEELEAEHDVAGDALHELTDLTNHFKLPEDACTTYHMVYEKLKALVADMYMHVHTENNVLFKRFL